MNRRALARQAARNSAPEGSLSLHQENDQTSGNDAMDKLTKKLNCHLQDGDYYGALQMYKTLFMRYQKNDPTEEKQKQAIELAFSACQTFIQNKQETSAIEMANLMLSIFTQFHFKVDEYTKHYLQRIYDAFTERELYSTEFAAFLKNVVEWSAKEGRRKRGLPHFQLLLARAYRAMNDYGHAGKHYLHSENPEEFACFLLEYAKTGYPSEADLFLARGVLQLLALENLKEANMVYRVFLEKAKDNKCQTNTPLTHFIRFLLATLERDALPLLQLLKDRYASALARDSNFQKYLSLIGERFFNVAPQRSGLSSIMDMFSGGLNAM